jgi:hypothetical protein
MTLMRVDRVFGQSTETVRVEGLLEKRQRCFDLAAPEEAPIALLPSIGFLRVGGFEVHHPHQAYDQGHKHHQKLVTNAHCLFSSRLGPEPLYGR